MRRRTEYDPVTKYCLVRSKGNYGLLRIATPSEGSHLVLSGEKRHIHGEHIRAFIIVDVQPTFCEGGALPVIWRHAVVSAVKPLGEVHRGDYQLIKMTVTAHDRARTSPKRRISWTRGLRTAWRGTTRPSASGVANERDDGRRAARAPPPFRGNDRGRQDAGGGAAAPPASPRLMSPG